MSPRCGQYGAVKIISKENEAACCAGQKYVYIENGWPQLISNAVLQKEKMGFIKQSNEERWNNSALWCQMKQTELWDGQEG